MFISRFFRYRYLVITAVVLFIGLILGASTVNSSTIPTITIVSVVPDTSVVVRTHNYPANQTFTVTMGEIGTRGIGGVVVATTESNEGGSFEATYQIPESLKGKAQIAIRLQSTQGYFSYNYFQNVATDSTPPGGTPGYSGIPTFKITAVTPDENVTIETNNFPANQTFTVTMGKFGTKGINGVVVGTLESEAGGTLTADFNIPDELKGDEKIAIRAQTAHANPYFAFNYFTNVAGDDGSAGTGGGNVPPTYTGIPTFKVCSVTKDTDVTIVTNNFPANQTFTVTMGPMYTRGINGTVVGTIESGDGGTLTKTFTIPAALKSSSRISIRAQTAHAYPFYSFNWFYNNTASVCN